jgi:DNA-3-methyladenine glycosylase
MRERHRGGRSASPLGRGFFVRSALDVAPDLLGMYLVHDRADGPRLVGRIVETEAYTHDDPAFRGWHAFDPASGLVRPTRRTADLFGPSGTAYVYKVYGYWLLNVVTDPEGTPGCVLLRAAEPLAGLDDMARRREAARTERDLANGPGKLTQAFALDGDAHGADLTQPPLYLADDGATPDDLSIVTSSRIGLSFGIDRPYRFFMDGNRYVSPGTPSDVKARRRRR